MTSSQILGWPKLKSNESNVRQILMEPKSFPKSINIHKTLQLKVMEARHNSDDGRVIFIGVVKG